MNHVNCPVVEVSCLRLRLFKFVLSFVSQISLRKGWKCQFSSHDYRILLVYLSYYWVCSEIAIDIRVVPTQLTDWDWLFDSDFSPLRRFEDHKLTGYTNALTKERISWRQVKEYSTYICTALVKKYGLKEGQTVSLFSQNSIWYSVVMYGVLRAGNMIAVQIT